MLAQRRGIVPCRRCRWSTCTAAAATKAATARAQKAVLTLPAAAPRCRAEAAELTQTSGSSESVSWLGVHTLLRRGKGGLCCPLPVLPSTALSGRSRSRSRSPPPFRPLCQSPRSSPTRGPAGPGADPTAAPNCPIRPFGCTRRKRGSNGFAGLPRAAAMQPAARSRVAQPGDRLRPAGPERSWTEARSRAAGRSWTMPSLRQGAGLRPKPNYGSDSGCGPEPDFGPKLICGPVVAAGGRGPWLDPLWCRSLDHRPPRRCPGSKGCMRSLCPAFACAVPAGCYPDGCGVGVVPVGRRRIDPCLTSAPKGLRVLDSSLEPSS